MSVILKIHSLCDFKAKFVLQNCPEYVRMHCLLSMWYSRWRFRFVQNPVYEGVCQFWVWNCTLLPIFEEEKMNKTSILLREYSRSYFQISLRLDYFPKIFLKCKVNVRLFHGRFSNSSRYYRFYRCYISVESIQRH